jgi:hypothetical protein
MRTFRAIDAPIDKYLYLRDLHDTDSRLYYTLLAENIEEVREMHISEIHEGRSINPIHPPQTQYPAHCGQPWAMHAPSPLRPCSTHA